MLRSLLLTALIQCSCFISIGQDTVWVSISAEEIEKMVENVTQELHSSKCAFSYTISSYNSTFPITKMEEVEGLYISDDSVRFSSIMDIEQIENDSCVIVKVKHDSELYIQVKEKFKLPINDNLIPASFASNTTCKRGEHKMGSIYQFEYSTEIGFFNCIYYFDKRERLLRIECNNGSNKVSPSVENTIPDTIRFNIIRLDEDEAKQRLKYFGYTDISTSTFLRGTERFSIYDLRP